MHTLLSCNQYDRMIKKKCEAILPSSTTNKLPIKGTNIKKKCKLVPGIGKDIRSLQVEKSTGTKSTSTTTIGGKKRGNEGAKTTGNTVDKKRGKYMSFSHRLQLQREAEQKFAKFIRFLL